MLHGRKLGDCLDEAANSFNFVRLLAALCVLVSHSFTLAAGLETPQPLESLTPFTLGQHAVNAFFVISGLMLARSLDRNPDIAQFVFSRILRIFPGLLVLGLLFAFVLGPALTDLPLGVYFSDFDTFTYPVAVLFKFNEAASPHGIFLTAPAGPLTNEPLWTIKYELTTYAGLVVIFALGLLRTMRGVLFCLVVTIILYFNVELLVPHSPALESTHHLIRYVFCFMIGVAAYHLRSRISVSPWLLVVSLLGVVLTRGTSLAAPAYFILIAHFVFVLASRRIPFFTEWSRKNDISYGTYIYGWPIQQLIVVLLPGLVVPGLMVISLLTVPVVGFFSWRIVEQPALRLKKYRIGRTRPNPLAATTTSAVE